MVNTKTRITLQRTCKRTWITKLVDEICDLDKEFKFLFMASKVMLGG